MRPNGCCVVQKDRISSSILPRSINCCQYSPPSASSHLSGKSGSPYNVPFLKAWIRSSISFGFTSDTNHGCVSRVGPLWSKNRSRADTRQGPGPRGTRSPTSSRTMSILPVPEPCCFYCLGCSQIFPVLSATMLTLEASRALLRRLWRSCGGEGGEQ